MNLPNPPTQWTTLTPEQQQRWLNNIYEYLKDRETKTTPVSGTEQATTSGTSKDFTSIPSWAKIITVQFIGVSVDASSDIIVQIGDSGGIETTGYLGAAWTSNTNNQNYTDGFSPAAVINAATVIHGTMTISLENGTANTWVASSQVAFSDSASMSFGSGSKSLSAALDRVRITTQGGTANFDAGSINILYE